MIIITFVRLLIIKFLILLMINKPKIATKLDYINFLDEEGKSQDGSHAEFFEGNCNFEEYELKFLVYKIINCTVIE